MSYYHSCMIQILVTYILFLSDVLCLCVVVQKKSIVQSYTNKYVGLPQTIENVKCIQTKPQPFFSFSTVIVNADTTCEKWNCSTQLCLKTWDHTYLDYLATIKVKDLDTVLKMYCPKIHQHSSKIGEECWCFFFFNLLVFVCVGREERHHH